MKRGLLLAGTIASTVALGAGVSAAACMAGGSGSAAAQSTTLGSAGAGTASNPTTTTLDLSWTAPEGLAPSGYEVTRDGTAIACDFSAFTPPSPTKCRDTFTGSETARTFSYAVTPVLAAWRGGATTFSGTPTQSAPAVTGPVAPESVTLTNGQGVGNAYVNSANRASVNVAVTMPATSLSSDTVTLTVSGPSGAPVAQQKAATTGAGTVLFNGLDLTGLGDGALTVAAQASNVTGGSPTTSTQVTKDTVAPANKLSLTSTNAHLDGVALSYKGNASGSFVLTNSLTDSGSGAFSTSYPALGTAGWVHDAETVTTPSAGPFRSSSYSWSGSPTNPTGSGRTITGADVAGNTATTTLTFASDVSSPSASSIGTTPTGTAGVVSSGDVITFTYSESVKPSSLLSGWNGSGTQTVSVTLNDGGGSADDSLTFGALNVGTVGLGNAGYATSSSTASATVTVSGATLTVTLTAGPASAVTCCGNSNHKLRWTPSVTATDLVGNASASAFKETSPQKTHF